MRNDCAWWNRSLSPATFFRTVLCVVSDSDWASWCVAACTRSGEVDTRPGNLGGETEEDCMVLLLEHVEGARSNKASADPVLIPY